MFASESYLFNDSFEHPDGLLGRGHGSGWRLIGHCTIDATKSAMTAKGLRIEHGTTAACVWFTERRRPGLLRRRVVAERDLPCARVRARIESRDLRVRRTATRWKHSGYGYRHRFSSAECRRREARCWRRWRQRRRRCTWRGTIITATAVRGGVGVKCCAADPTTTACARNLPNQRKRLWRHDGCCHNVNTCRARTDGDRTAHGVKVK